VFKLSPASSDRQQQVAGWEDPRQQSFTPAACIAGNSTICGSPLRNLSQNWLERLFLPPKQH
tara:strand:- start:24 stop:209 length:186 start_codon:yes stop_codon:yes gene_type:complete